ncbi:putative NudC domain-containing protein 3 [Hypsibius exemplaris]|uniref:NudC domain-containing protein 3 n=1 Tax=Hypsibius exemplaris TaxID=2072580 RepID=A0A9X6NGH8_HYPEX|nr:putative NudC domain-containing protein 3 [Hypsibius exemplaris]
MTWTNSRTTTEESSSGCSGINGVYDETLLGILRNEGQVAPFLDAVFGFLWRRTDFFQPLAPDGTLGFAEGAALKLVAGAFRKYEILAEGRGGGVATEEKSAPTREGDKPTADNPASHSPTETTTSSTMASPETGERRPIPIITAQHVDDAGNGAVHDRYSWNQTHRDLDVRVFVPRTITKSKQLQVELRKTTMRVCLKGADHNEVILEGAFKRPINSAESMWIFVPGEYVQMTLEKETEGWWDGLLEGEGVIDLSRIDAEVSFQEMDSAEQQLIRKLIHEQKMKPPSGPTPEEQAEVEAILRAPWPVDGPLFKGQPLNPSALPQ